MELSKKTETGITEKTREGDRRKTSEKWRKMNRQGRQSWLLKILPTERYGEVYQHSDNPSLEDLLQEKILKEKDIKTLLDKGFLEE